MRVWLITVGEPLPTDQTDARLLRTGMLADIISQQGHQVVWWTSSFDHVRKLHRCERDARLRVRKGYEIQLLRGSGYRRDVSWQRIRDHRQVARRFEALAVGQPRPDVILCSLPTLELSQAAVRYGQRVASPVVLDVRDLWPEALIDLAPRFVKPLAEATSRVVLPPARRVCAAATAFTALTHDFLAWALRHAEREQAPLDKVFPMAYREETPTSREIYQARRFWSEHGIMPQDNSFTACFFGTLGRHFELPVVLEASRLVTRSLRDIRFVLCGTGEELARLRHSAADCHNVLLPGWVSAAQIWTLMRMSAVGLAPYVSTRNLVANLPNKPIEYLSAGLPIISSLQGSLATLLAKHRCGITYENGNASQLADALIQLLDWPRLRAAMSENAEELYRGEYVAEKVYLRMVEHLETVARHTARRRKAA